MKYGSCFVTFIWGHMLGLIVFFVHCLIFFQWSQDGDIAGFYCLMFITLNNKFQQFSATNKFVLMSKIEQLDVWRRNYKQYFITLIPVHRYQNLAGYVAASKPIRQ